MVPGTLFLPSSLEIFSLWGLSPGQGGSGLPQFFDCQVTLHCCSSSNCSLVQNEYLLTLQPNFNLAGQPAFAPGTA